MRTSARPDHRLTLLLPANAAAISFRSKAASQGLAATARKSKEHRAASSKRCAPIGEPSVLAALEDALGFRAAVFTAIGRGVKIARARLDDDHLHRGLATRALNSRIQMALYGIRHHNPPAQSRNRLRALANGTLPTQLCEK
ncbi:MAG: hypothetical protein ACRECC_00915 [Pseudolabrys sp.]